MCFITRSGQVEFYVFFFFLLINLKCFIANGFQSNLLLVLLVLFYFQNSIHTWQTGKVLSFALYKDRVVKATIVFTNRITLPKRDDDGSVDPRY